MPYLVGLTIGPVQLNIQQSRKLKDIYNSSKIISDLMRKVIEYLESDKNYNLIYPCISNNVDITNRLFCIIEDINILKKIEKEIFENSNKKFFEDYFLFWAASENLEASDIVEYYDIHYSKVNLKLNSIKNTYVFSDSHTLSRNKKCSICGKREQMKNLSICEVCNYKRNYRDVKYDSTYSIALSNWKERNKSSISEVSNRLNKIFIDDSKYYNLTYLDSVIKRLESDDLNKNITDDMVCDINNYQVIMKELNTIKDDLFGVFKKIDKPDYKYCFMQLDIDDFGKWIDGKYCDDKGTLMSFQKELSKILSNFSKEIKEIFDNYVVYCGGDDILLVTPVDEVFVIFREIEELFEKKVLRLSNELVEYQKYMTFSTVISVSNCNDDMASVIKTNRELLEKSKRENNDKGRIVLNYVVNNQKNIVSSFTKNSFDTFINILLGSRIDSGSFTFIDKYDEEIKKIDLNNIEDFKSIYTILTLEFNRILKRSSFDELNSMKIYEYFKCILNEIIDNESEFVNVINIFKTLSKLYELNINNGGDKSESNTDKTD